MRRRDFLGAVGSAAVAWPLAAAPKTERTRLISVLMTFAEADPEGQARLAAFQTTFRELGWIDGQNSRIVVRWAAGDMERTQRFAMELIALRPDVAVVMSAPALVVMQRETSAVPIVFVQVSDPVGSGFVASMSRPGGNITGFANFETSMASKWIELLKEVAPHVSRIAFLIHAGLVPHLAFWRVAQDAAPSFGVQLTAAEVRNHSEVERAIAAFAADGNGGLIVLPDPVFNTLRDSIVEWTARYRLPAIYPFRFYALAGGLLSYGIDQIDQWRGTARYVDRILRGEKAADLPVQAPDKFELLINLISARALGLTVPPTLLTRADEVIE